MFSFGKSFLYTATIGSYLMMHKNYDYKVYNFTYPPTRDRIRGEYENKIRMDCTPEKIFEVFATLKKDGRIYMSRQDLFRAITPFCYSTKKKEKGDDDDKDDKKKDKKDGVDEKLTLQEDKRVEPEFDFSKSILADFADSNGDGFISLYEFYILVLILQATDDVTKQAFLELSPVGELNKQQFQDCLTKIMKTGTTSKLTISRFLPDPRKEHLSQEKASRGGE